MKKIRVKKLTEKEKEKLLQLYKQDKTKRVRERSQIILLSNKGKTVKELVSIFELTRQVICTLINNFNKKGTEALYDAKRSGCPEKLTEVAKKEVLDMLAKDSRNINKILAELKNKFDIEISKKT